MDRGTAHRPVLLSEVVALLAPTDGDLIVDCTIGTGGHAKALLHAAGPGAHLLGIDLDEGNLRRARERLKAPRDRARLFHASFADVADVLAEAGQPAADVLLADLGIASCQLDDPARGFDDENRGVE